jgi:transposase
MGFDMMSIPGIGYQTAAIIASEVGNKFDCFPSEKHFASYIGLAPSLGKSAGKNVRQKKCKNTSRVGRALRMAASTLYRSNTELGASFRNVAGQTDKKTAIRATARRMAHMIYRGVVYGKEFIDRGALEHEVRLRARTVKTVNKLIKSFDINSSEIIVAPATA